MVIVHAEDEDNDDHGTYGVELANFHVHAWMECIWSLYSWSIGQTLSEVCLIHEAEVNSLEEQDDVSLILNSLISLILEEVEVGLFAIVCGYWDLLQRRGHQTVVAVGDDDGQSSRYEG